MTERPVKSRPIPNSNWDLVFTQTGKYFFFDSIKKRSHWGLESRELEDLLKSLPEHVLQALFDPDVEEDVLASLLAVDGYCAESESDDVDYELDENIYDKDEPETFESEEILSQGPSHEAPHIETISEEEHQRRIANFIALLKNKRVDPFKPWDKISEDLQHEPDFQAIASAKERANLFAMISPELVEVIRSERSSSLDQAKESWRSLLESMDDLSKIPSTWTEYSRQLKKTAPWFKLLDSRSMEKDYRARINTLRQQNIRYNVKTNNA